MNVTYDYYRIFYYVAKCGSFTKAAEVIGNSQPNITRAMNNLESQIGLKLFVRNKRGVVLTPEGEQLYEHVKIAFFHLTQAEVEMEKNRELVSGSVVIGVSEIALHEVLLPKLELFHEQYPGVKIQLTNQSTPETINGLKRGMVDFALVTTPFEISYPLNHRKIKDFKEVLVAGRNYAELREKKVSLKELENFQWVSLLHGTATRKHYEELFKNYSMRYEPQFLAATTDQILPMIKAGLGIGFVPEEMVYKDDGFFVIDLEEEFESRSVHVITDVERPLSAAAMKLIEMIEN